MDCYHQLFRTFYRSHDKITLDPVIDSYHKTLMDTTSTGQISGCDLMDPVLAWVPGSRDPAAMAYQSRTALYHGVQLYSTDVLVCLDENLEFCTFEV